MSEAVKKNRTILEVKGLRVEFSRKGQTITAVDDVNFTLDRGETLGMVGESGSGKSVTSLSLLRLINNPPGRIADGQILFRSKLYGEVDLLRLTEAQMREIRGNEIAMIFQDPMSSLNPVYTCGKQVMEALLLHETITRSEAKRRVISLFEDVHLPRPEEMFYEFPHQLSGGQKQRVMIAMALACKPQVLIADEPTTALDVTVQAQILHLIAELQEKYETATLFITHDLGVIAEVAERVQVMYHGKIVEQGTVWDIFSNPQHPYTKGLLACRPRLDLKLNKLPVVSDFMETDADGNLVEVQQPKFQSVGQAIMLSYEAVEDMLQKQEARKTQAPILEVRNLKTYFPTKRNFFGKAKSYIKAVDDVTFEVYPGETLGLVGESGCGKSTLGRSILQLVKPTAGEVIFEKQNICHLNKKEIRRLRSKIQIIFQDPYASLNPRKTIGEAIVEPMRVHGLYDSEKERKEQALSLLETVSLSSIHFDRYPHEFSGGQRQRICIARTLALKPRFIICDESVSALDVSVQAQVLNLLNELKEKFNFTYIFISHDLAVVKFIADRILVMNKGKIEEINHATDVYENPKTEYTRKLIASIPVGDLDNIRKAMLRRKIKEQEKIG